MLKAPLRRWAEESALAPVWRLLRHPVPAGTTTPRAGWMYALGIATLTAFILQVVTGAVLASKYVPSTARAHETLRFITDEVSWGGTIRGMHYFGASAMVVLVVLHMARTYLTGAYKFPREVNWMSGVLLLVLTFAMALTGQVLRWDRSGVEVLTGVAERLGALPWIGGSLASLLLAGDAAGVGTLSRVYTIHILVLPLGIFALVGLHLYLAQIHGVSEPPSVGEPVRPETYRARYESRVRRGGALYFPDALWRETVLAVLVIVAVVGLAIAFGPHGPGLPATAQAADGSSRPDWYLLWYRGLERAAPAGLETLVLVYAPIALVLALLALPLAAPAGERHPLRRPWAVAAVAITLVSLLTLSWLGR